MRPREEAVYAGALAATRRDVVFVTNPDGTARKVEVVVSVNAATDPVLAEAARNGTLHHVDSLELAVPFAYHDPLAKKFALVVPLVRAHEEMQLRIELLRKLADERIALPSYVREARVVVGPKGLDRLLAEPDARALVQREAQIAAREERLHVRAEDVTRREDDLRTQLEQLAADRAELEERAEELAVREVTLQSREREFEAARARLEAERARLEAERAQQQEQLRAATSREQPGTSERRLSDGAAGGRISSTSKLPTRPSTASMSDAETSQPIELIAKRSSAGGPTDSVEEAEPIESEPLQEPMAMDVEEAEAVVDAAAADEAEPIADGAVEEAEPIEAESAGDAIEAEPVGEPMDGESGVDELDPLEGETSPADEDLLAAVPTDEREQPRRDVHWLTGDRDSRAAVVDGEVRLWLRGSGETVLALGHGEAVPVLQMDPGSSLPLALLSVLSNDGATRFGRASLDATTAEDRAVIDALARDFHVRVEVVSRDGRSLGGHAVSARGGEAHARKVGEILAARASGDALARRVEADRLAREGISYHGGVSDEQAQALFDEQQLATAQGVERALRVIEAVSEPEARERWQLARGVPTARLEASEKRVLFAMLRVGVKPSKPVLDRALALGVASDERALALKSLTAFARTCDAGPTKVGLDPQHAYEYLGNLIVWAHRAGVSPIPPAALDTVARLYDPESMDGPEFEDPRPTPSDVEMAAMDVAELVRWCAHPKARAAAALRLAKKDARSHGATLARALKLLDATAAAPVLSAMLSAGDELGDAWVELAASRRPVAAAAGAVAIAKIKLRRGLLPVLQRALSSGTTESQLFGWAAGEFGVAAVRAMTASMLEGDGVERAAWVLAHVVRAGGGREVERVRTADEGPLSAAATQGVGVVDDARDYDRALREGKGLTPGERAASVFLTMM